MDLEALRKKSDSILDVISGPNAGNTVQAERLLDINAENARVRMNAARQGSMQHIRKTNIADVDAASGEKAARLVWFNAAADESR